MTGAPGIFRRAVEGVWGWRRANFGQPTPEYTHQVMVSTDVQWQQIGASVQVDRDEAAVFVVVYLGPLGLRLLTARRVLLDHDPARGGTWSRTFTRGRRTFYVGLNLNYWGLLAQWMRDPGGLTVKAFAGPFVVCWWPARHTWGGGAGAASGAVPLVPS